MSNMTYRIKEVIRHPICIIDKILFRIKTENIIMFFVDSLDVRNTGQLAQEAIQNLSVNNLKTQLMYILVRHLKPDVVIETGVARGDTSQAILKAMQINDKGHLYSIDLNQEKSIDGSDRGYYKTGDRVTEDLKKRWTLIDGDSKIELPKLLQRVPSVDIFFHDSLHTFDHMLFEYTTVWDHIKSDGWLVSDDAFWNHAFMKFASGKDYHIIDKKVGLIKKEGGVEWRNQKSLS